MACWVIFLLLKNITINSDALITTLTDRSTKRPIGIQNRNTVAVSIGQCSRCSTIILRFRTIVIVWNVGIQYSVLGLLRFKCVVSFTGFVNDYVYYFLSVKKCISVNSKFRWPDVREPLIKYKRGKKSAFQPTSSVWFSAFRKMKLL